MANVQLGIQGQDAIAATEELFFTSGLSGDWKVAIENKTKAEPVTTTIATIVSVAGGSIVIAEPIPLG